MNVEPQVKDIEAGEYLLVRTGSIDGYFKVTETKDAEQQLLNEIEIAILCFYLKI